MKKIHLKVDGMHCKSCEILIDEELEDTGAVRNVKVSFEKGSVELEFNEDKISLGRIKEIIKGEGYTVK
tara:strand:- start:7324 stop:7530 length:207 start_codon:yes stop_codon:yes gene_type:complete